MFDMDWATLKKKLDQHGFEVFYEETFPDTAFCCKEWKEVKVEPHLIVAGNVEEKVLLVAHSFFRRGSPPREVVTHIKIYGCVLLPKDTKFTFGGREVWGKILTDEYYIRPKPLQEVPPEGYRCYYTQSLSAGFDFPGRLRMAREALQVADWNEPDRFLWFLNSTEPSTEWKQKRAEVLEQAPEGIRQFIGLEELESQEAKGL